MAKSGVVLAVVLVAGAFAAGLGLGLVVGAPAPVLVEGDGPGDDAKREVGADETGAPPSDESSERRRRRDTENPRAPPSTGASPEGVDGGSGTITGSVKTAGGAPIEGVVVVSRPQGASGPKATRRPAPFDERNLGDLVRELEERYHRTRRLRREGVTGADGTFAIDDLADGKHRLTLKKKGYRFETAPGAKGLVGEAGDALDFTAVPVVAVTVDVRMPDGSTPETAYVAVQRATAQGGRSKRNERWYRDEPEIQVEPGSYTLRASAQGEMPLRSKDVPLVVGESESGETVLLQLAGAPMVRVNLTFAEGEVWQGLQLRLLRTSKGARPDLERLRREGKYTAVHASKTSGDFMDVVPGAYLVGVSVSNGRILASREVEVAEGPAVVDLAIPPLAREEYAVLHVVDPAGEPLSDLAFTTGVRRSGSSSSAGGYRVLIKGGGVFWVLHQDSNHVSSHGADAAVWWIEVKSAIYGSRTIEYHDTSNTELRVQFEEPAALDVQLAGFTGRGLEGLLAIAVGKKGTSHYVRNQSAPQIDENGRYHVPILAPGEHDVVVSVRHGNSVSEIMRQTVVVQSGENEVTVALPALHALTVELSGPATKGTVGLYMRSGRKRLWIQPRSPDDAGRVVFEHLPAGEYSVQIYNVKNAKPRKVKVPDESIVRF